MDAEAKLAESTKIAKKVARMDPIHGSWTVVFSPKGKPKYGRKWTIQESGKMIAFTEKPGKTPTPGTWRKRGDGRYVVTAGKGGGTSTLTLDPNGEQMKGHLTNKGSVHATRQATQKK